ncbi:MULTISPECIES: methyltransferase domain-containing protein [Actinoalloteichus]|uniref:Protein-L-isoaspartate O-methyltransferase n=1 Tax=Actinoalloteichus fjordicus TaxID=1612552 RepID=A0AAC9PT65_9PSEU|nr:MULTISPECIES: methyltransferase domain-containing protein [Actinoalloteichus]APU15712.1 Protein-L-isoaspartate(D-aspartate) O-methyltransferase (PCMT) [Actinoalloteichus fjordicus]APU21772.1 Protein-L-isoaspartate(D-aspartate) O-methyltransferase (PCMT) [Actinoalloteichus sp. GBA129-24]
MTDWRAQLTVPRAPFIPQVVWVDDPATGDFRAVSRNDDEPRWQALVDVDEPIVTQVDDGATAPGDAGRQPSSSCSQPSLVAAMLTTLDVHAGHRVLEIGAGTGWNAALLSARTGAAGHVVSVEVDPAVAEGARRALAEIGATPSVVTGDGTRGYAPDAPYDRVVCTASVRAIPRAWLEQTRPGGVILAPWGTDYGSDALTRLVVDEAGGASGRCGRGLSFMRIRQQRRDFLEPSRSAMATAATSQTTRRGRELFEMVAFAEAAFTIGLRVPSCYLTVEDLDADHRRIELHDVRSASWARVGLVRGADPWTVHQLGPRRLWDEVDAAYAWWCAAGRPTPDRYGLTVTPAGDHEVWIDIPEDARRWALPAERPGPGR